MKTAAINAKLNKNTLSIGEPSFFLALFSFTWEQRELGGFSNVITKGTTPLDKTSKGDVNFIKIENIDSGSGDITPISKITNEEHSNYLKRSQLKENDILFSIAGTLGRVTSVNKEVLPANTNQALAIIRLDSGDLEYIKTYLKGHAVSEFVKKNPTVGAQPNLSLEQVSNLKIKYPKPEEQAQIGTFFQTLDNLITCHQRECEFLYKEQNPCCSMNLTLFTTTWEQRELNDVVDFYDEKRRPIEADARVKGVYPYYGASGIIDYVEDYLFDGEMILLSEDGANIIDRNYRVSFLASGKYWVNNHAHVLKAKSGYTNSFVCESLERLNYEQYNTGTAQPKLNQDVCKNIIIDVSSVEEQTAIGTFFQTLDNLITCHQRKPTKTRRNTYANRNNRYRTIP